MKKILNGVEVDMTEEEIAFKLQFDKANQLDQANQEYKFLRMQAYPTLQEQMDILYHQGFDAWKEIIKTIKDKYPKPGA